MGYRVYFNYEDDMGNVESLYESFEDLDNALCFMAHAEQLNCYFDIELVDLEIDDL